MEDYMRGNDLGEDGGRWKREWEVEGEGLGVDVTAPTTILACLTPGLQGLPVQ